MKRAVLYAHYDRNDIVEDYVLYALREHRRFCDTLIFVSTAGLDDKEQEKAARYADRILVRDNSGYDFMSWKCALALLDNLENYDEILFTNDSIYGPLWPMEKVYEQSSRIDADLWGLCINHQVSRHVQSWFFAFRKILIRSGVMQEFWETVHPIEHKMTIIKKYEIGLSKFVEKRGYITGAMFEPHWLSPTEKLRLIIQDMNLREPRRSFKFAKRVIHAKTMNPNHELWREMIQAGVPFIKVELLRDNPQNVGLEAIYRFVSRELPDYHLGYIHDHARRNGWTIGNRKRHPN